MIGNRYLSAIIAVLCVSCPYVQSQDTDSRVSPLYFGPNAMPVPEMLEGVVYERLHSELAFDLHKGYHGDLTGTVYAELNIPLFSPRVNLSLWMPVVEFYSNTAESLAWQDPQVRSLKGTAIGKLYISTDIQLLKQIPQHHGQGKAQHGGRHRSAGQIPLHGRIPLFFFLKQFSSYTISRKMATSLFFRGFVSIRRGDIGLCRIFQLYILPCRWYNSLRLRKCAEKESIHYETCDPHL